MKTSVMPFAFMSTVKGYMMYGRSRLGPCSSPCAMAGAPLPHTGKTPKEEGRDGDTWTLSRNGHGPGVSRYPPTHPFVHLEYQLYMLCNN